MNSGGVGVIVTMLARANPRPPGMSINAGDPAQPTEAVVPASRFYELGLTLGGRRKEDASWHQTLRALAAHLGAPVGEHTTSVVCVDKRRQWQRVGNIWHNAAIRTMLHIAATPVHALRRLVRRRGRGHDNVSS